MERQAFEIYRAGCFISTSEKLHVFNPYDGSIVAETSLAGSADVDIAIQAAQAVEDELALIPSYIRSNILKQISNDILSLRQQFAELITLESGKPIKYSLSEVDRSIQTFLIAAEECKRLPAEYFSVDWTPAGKGKEGLLKYFPVGIVAGIAPFNFPLNLAVHKLAPAIAAGCPIILKPSSLTPLSTLFLSQLIDRTVLPKGAVSIMPMDRNTGNTLVTDKRIGLLSFTGSPEVGWKMKNESGKKKVVLELGGNAGVIVSQSDNIDAVVKKCIAGGFSYSGQVCIHTQRIYVIEELFEEFTEKFMDQVKLLKAGNPISPDTDMAVMIDESNAKRVENWINNAVLSGAKILSGGQREGNYLPPTVLTQTKGDMQVCSEEVFGPVVVIEPVCSFSDAIQHINSGRFGLQAGVFTNSISEMNMAFSKLKVGGVILNDVPTFRVDHMPYGGVKDSGLGREGVKYAILDMMEPRLLVKDS